MADAREEPAHCHHLPRYAYSNTINLDWNVSLKEPEETKLEAQKEEIDYFTELFNNLEGDFDVYISLILQDMLDLPFGAMCEIGREGDKPDGKVLWAEHVDAATLVPTGNPDWPVLQQVPDLPSRPVVFPKHATNRAYLNPTTQIKRKGWGMAPPEKVYLAIEMLYRGDRYYANLLLDTPEAGILDLMDMSEEDATNWLESFRTLFAGIDGFKVPVLYQHQTPAQWIPLNRPPIDMMYDSTTLKYAQICCAGYGIRLSDIGMAELAGEKTLAGVIRGERQSRRSGYGTVRSKLKSHFERMLPPYMQFVWEEKDEEAKTSQARALSTYGLALGQLKRDGLLDPAEARLELVATGLLETEIDPEKVPEPEVPMGMPGQGIFDKPGKRKPFGKPSDQDRGRIKGEDRAARKPPTEGGRGEVTITRQAEVSLHKATHDELIEKMNRIVQPAIQSIPDLAEPPRLRRLIKVITRAMVPMLQPTFQALDNETIERSWLPEMQALEFDLPSELDSYVVRQSAEELRELLEEHLEDDPWWKTASVWDKDQILAVFKEAYELGLEDMAIRIVRALYEEGLASTPVFSPTLSFNLVNKRTLSALETAAADMVTNVNDGTKYFIKRITVAGVRQGLARPKIAEAIRDGVKAEQILKTEGFMDDIISQILQGLIEMTERRALSIVNTETNRAMNAGHLEQLTRTGLQEKAWKHFGPRGITKKGNIHPCPVCTRNEELGFVPKDYLFETVFKRGGPEGDGRALTPPAHPEVCHCGVIFNEEELFATVKKGEYAPYLGGR